jgi:hypothetical protein
MPQVTHEQEDMARNDILKIVHAGYPAIPTEW